MAGRGKGKTSNWKVYERKIAKFFKGERVIRPDWGMNDLDVLAPPFGIECKYRKEINYDAALEQVEEIIRTVENRKGLLPLAVVQKVGTAGKEEAVFRMALLAQLGLVKEVEQGIAEIIVVVPLSRFLRILDEGGIVYGQGQESGAESSCEEPD